VLKRASYAEIAPLLCAGATVYEAIKTSNFKPGDLCLVQGIGGLGHLAIQVRVFLVSAQCRRKETFILHISMLLGLASRCGFKCHKCAPTLITSCQVYAVSSGPSKAALAKSLGAFAHIDSSATSVVDLIQSLGGANLIVTTSPTVHSITSIIPAVARNGTVTLVSAAIDGRIEVDNVLMNMRRVTLRGWSCGAAPDYEECIRFSTLTGTFDFREPADMSLRPGDRYKADGADLASREVRGSVRPYDAWCTEV
jgi:propanol-preferring alcohol dehydrogenase